MAITAPPVLAQLLTYEDYLSEGEINRRYDIIDGERIWMNPTRDHQDIAGNLFELLRAYQRAARKGKAIYAPSDVLIRRSPLRTRQPDVLFISYEQLARNAPSNTPTPLEAAPELVVEVLSPSETRRSKTEKIEDYRSVGVKECWIVSPVTQSVEILLLSPDGVESGGVFGSEQSVRSIVFEGLEVSVEAIFEES